MSERSTLIEKQANIVNDRTNQIARLKDGRNLGYAEYGDFNGDIVLYFHGSPSSRLEAAALHEAAMYLNIHIISIDRPGMGLSTFKNNRHILDFADDISELADALYINRFAVMGMSGGGPYVCACIYKIPKRIISACIVSGIGPIKESGITSNMIASTRLPIWLAPRFPYLMKVLFILMLYRIRRKHDLFFWKSLPPPDQATLSLPSIKYTWIESILEAFRYGTKGPVMDMALFEKPWGFDPENLNIPVHIWHGELDRNVPIMAARRLAERIPNCQTTFYSNEGHFSLWLNYVEEILATLILNSDHDQIKQIHITR